MIFRGYFRIKWFVFFESLVVLTESARRTAFGWCTIYAGLIISARKLKNDN